MELNSNKLKQLRLDRKIPLKDVADHLGLRTAGGYLRIESGENKLKAEHLPIIATLFNLDLNELFSAIFFDTELDETPSSHQDA